MESYIEEAREFAKGFVDKCAAKSSVSRYYKGDRWRDPNTGEPLSESDLALTVISAITLFGNWEVIITTAMISSPIIVVSHKVNQKTYLKCFWYSDCVEVGKT